MEEPTEGQASDSGRAPLWPEALWEATARGWAAQVTCRECGAESTGAESTGAESTGAESTGSTGVCARCGAPLGLEPPVAAAPPPGGPGIPAPPLPWDPYYYWAPGQQPRPNNSRRTALIVAGAGGALLLALIAVIGVRAASTSATSTPTALTPAVTPAVTQLTWDELVPGDCLAGSNMGLGNTKPWPDLVTQVPCTQPHVAEVFFAGNLWPQSQAYPGKDAIDNQTWTRCNTTFTAYDGIDASFEGDDPPSSAFTFTDIADDDSADWASGERRVVCVAYEPDFSNLTTGATPVDYSIRGTKK